MKVQVVPFVLFLPVLATVLFYVGSSDRQPEFLKRTVRSAGQAYGYRVYVPENRQKDQKWPVILFLHGAGERGEDNSTPIWVGLGRAIRDDPDRFPAVVVFPQCRSGHWWTDPEMEAQALKALEQSIKEFNGDAERIYLTGISMGGYGAWRFAANHPGRFAALAPICGGIDVPGKPYLEMAKRIGNTSVWAFHGSEDATVPVSESRKMVEALKQAGGNVKYTEYKGVGHNSWDRAYAEAELIPWLLAQ